MTTLLITGAAGFLGRHVLAALPEGEYVVHATSREPRAAERDVQWHQVDLLHPADREALIAGVQAEVLIHLAWYAKPPSYYSAPENLEWLTASLELFRLFARGGGRRIVGVGSCMEYDWEAGYCSELRTPLRPGTLYGTAKASCGSMLEAYSREVRLSAAWARPFFVFGPYDSPLRLVPSLVRALVEGREAVCRTGAHVRDFVHVADVAEALVALTGSAVTGPVNLASGSPMRVADVAALIARRIGRDDLLTVHEGPPDSRFVCADVARLRDEVGWRPRVDVTARLEETIAWWRSTAGAAVSV